MIHPLRLNKFSDGKPVTNWPAFLLMALWWFVIFGPLMYLVRRALGDPITMTTALWWGAYMGLWMPLFLTLAQRKKLRQSETDDTSGTAADAPNPGLTSI